MIRKLLRTIFILLFLATSCSEEDNNSDNTIKISGFVRSSDNSTEENVKVSISNFVNLTDFTDSEGYFEIEGVSKGAHDLTLFKNNIDSNSGVFVQRTVSVLANADITLDALTLPNPVVLNPASEITSSSALLSWNNSTDDGFREYKLYRHNSSGLDETTGTLVHVTTDVDEISFLDEDLSNSEVYFYRVFVLDEFGQIGGSNVISFETQSVQIIKNGSFEDVTGDVPIFWMPEPNDFGNPENSITVDNANATDGLNSLKFHHAEENGCWEQWIKQDIENNALIEGATYKLTFDYKSDFSLSNPEVDLIIRNSNFELNERYNINLDFLDDGLWRTNDFEFTLPSEFANNNIHIIIAFCNMSIGNYWLDNISVERVN
tara:strand:+ start:191 stop:1318 length:1128 start_codon:yes stop_codon:yes gene_type:complete